MPEEQVMREARSGVVWGLHLDGASGFCSGPTHGFFVEPQESILLPVGEHLGPAFQVLSAHE